MADDLNVCGIGQSRERWRLHHDVISGGRVLYVNKGTVAASVDFSELNGRMVVPSPIGKAVMATLLAPTVDTRNWT